MQRTTPRAVSNGCFSVPMFVLVLAVALSAPAGAAPGPVFRLSDGTPVRLVVSAPVDQASFPERGKATLEVPGVAQAQRVIYVVDRGSLRLEYIVPADKLEKARTASRAIVKIEDRRGRRRELTAVRARGPAAVMTASAKAAQLPGNGDITPQPVAPPAAQTPAAPPSSVPPPAGPTPPAGAPSRPQPGAPASTQSDSLAGPKPSAAKPGSPPSPSKPSTAPQPASPPAARPKGAEQKSYLLTVERQGGGTVTSVPQGISCGSTCSGLFKDRDVVTLTAKPETGFRHADWSGCDSTPGLNCTVTIDKARVVEAVFAPSTLRLSVFNPDGIKVTIAPPNVECPPTCDPSYAQRGIVRIVPKTAQGISWHGCDQREGATCVVKLDRPRSVRVELSWWAWLTAATPPWALWLLGAIAGAVFLFVAARLVGPWVRSFVFALGEDRRIRMEDRTRQIAQAELALALNARDLQQRSMTTPVATQDAAVYPPLEDIQRKIEELLQARALPSQQDIDTVQGDLKKLSAAVAELGGPRDVEALAGASRFAQMAASDSSVLASEERQLVAAVNAWWEEARVGGERSSRQALVNRLSEFTDRLKFCNLQEIEKRIALPGGPYQFVPSPTNGVWLLLDLPNGRAIALPVDHRPFVLRAINLLEQMFEGWQAHLDSLRFEQAYRPCRLRRVGTSPHLYEVERKGYLKLEGVPAFPDPPPSLPDRPSTASTGPAGPSALAVLAATVTALRQDVAAILAKTENEARVTQELRQAVQQLHDSQSALASAAAPPAVDLTATLQAYAPQLSEVSERLSAIAARVSILEQRSTTGPGTGPNAGLVAPEHRVANLEADRRVAITPRTPERVVGADVDRAPRAPTWEWWAPWIEKWAANRQRSAPGSTAEDDYLRDLVECATTLRKLAADKGVRTEVDIVHLELEGFDRFRMRPVMIPAEGSPPACPVCPALPGRMLFQHFLALTGRGDPDVRVLVPPGSVIAPQRFSAGYGLLMRDPPSTTQVIGGVDRPAVLRAARDGSLEVQEMMRLTPGQPRR